MNYKKNITAGFTLIELLVVVAIMGVLSSIILVSINRARSNARDAQRIAEINQMRKAVEIYYLNHNSYPHVNNVELANGWNSMIDYLRVDGLLSVRNDSHKNFSFSNFSEYILPKALAYTSCPVGVAEPQDPLYECVLTESPLSPVSITYTYGYMSSLHQGWQFYRLRTKLENSNHFILRSGLGGDFAAVGDSGCDTTEGYYCIGNSGLVPD